MLVTSLVYDKIPLSNHFRDKPVCLGVFDGLAADLDTMLLSSGIEQKVVVATNINPKFVRAKKLSLS